MKINYTSLFCLCAVALTVGYNIPEWLPHWASVLLALVAGFIWGRVAPIMSKK